MTPELTGRDLLNAVVDMWEQNRPTKWIARSTGVATADVATILRAAGLKPRDVNYRTLEKYDRMESMILDGASHSEIARTLKCDHRTIKTWFPGTEWSAGGWADTGAAMIREVNRKLRAMDDFGYTRKQRGKD